MLLGKFQSLSSYLRLKILPDYVDYLKKNPYSMLAKIYGVFSLKRTMMKTVIVMLMENTIQLENSS